jgi:hypothetical protein
MLKTLKKVLPLAALALLTGCTGTLTNLSANYQTRRPDGLYPVAVAFETRQASVRWESIKPYVVVGANFYPMRPMPLMNNRWETLIPVPANVNEVNYRYKFDWQYNAIPVPQNDSMQSKPQLLHILEH